MAERITGTAAAAVMPLSKKLRLLRSGPWYFFLIAVEKLFGLPANYPKGDGATFHAFMLERFLGAP